MTRPPRPSVGRLSASPVPRRAGVRKVGVHQVSLRNAGVRSLAVRRAGLLWVAAFLAAALAGCAAPAKATTHLTIDFFGAVRPSLESVLPFDDQARPAAALYTGNGTTHPAFYNALDQLVDWRHAGGPPLRITHSQYGFFLEAIDGIPAAGASTFWILSVNGAESLVGMDQVQLHEGDRVTWRLTSYDAGGADSGGGAAGPSPSGGAQGSPAANGTAGPTGRPTTTTGTGPGGLEVTIAAPAASKVPTVVVHGTVKGTARVGLAVTHAGRTPVAVAADVVAGRWSARVTLTPGTYDVSATADSGTATAKAHVALTVLANATMQVKYTAYPLHASSSDVVFYDPDQRASGPMYNGTDVQHPDAATVHDLMVTWTDQTGIAIDYDYFAGLGYSPSKFDGIGQPVSAAAPPYWCYKLNGKTSDFGISLQPVAPGDVVLWEYAGCA